MKRAVWLVCLMMAVTCLVFATDGRIPIYAGGTTISTAGSYYLTSDITVGAGDAITIGASNITIDLMGHTVTGNVGQLSGYSKITILNGVIVGKVQFNGTYQITLRDIQMPGQVIDIQSSHGTVIEHCRASQIKFTAVVNSRIAYCQLETPPDSNGCIYLTTQSKGVQVLDNSVQDNTLGNGIFLSYVEDCVVSGNTVRHVANSGIQLAYSESCTISHNAISDGSEGIGIVDSSANQITYNTCYGNSSYGMRLAAGGATTISGNDISYNTCWGNSNSGIYLQSTFGGAVNIAYNRIANNVCSQNTQYGIYVGGVGSAISGYNTLEWNTASGNQTGISFNASSAGNVYSFNRAKNNSSANYQDLGAGNTAVVYSAGNPTNN